MTVVKVAAIQARPVGDELAHPKNIRHALELLRKCVEMDEEVEVACFPEYFPWSGREELAREAGELGIYVIAGLAEREAGALYNSCVLFGPDGSIVGRQRKLSLGYMERKYLGFTPGHELCVFDTEFGRVGIGVCADLWGPPNVGRQLLRMGAELIFNPSFFFVLRDVWHCLLLARAVELMVPIVAVDTAEFPFRLGDRVFRECGGLTCIVGPPWRDMGEFASWWHGARFNWFLGWLGTEEGILIRELDLDRAREFRRAWFSRIVGREDPWVAEEATRIGPA